MVDENPIVEVPKPSRDCATPNVKGLHSSIRKPVIQANNFELKPSIIQMIQSSTKFGGLPSEDPNTHIMNFLEICDTFKHNKVSNDIIRLRLFLLSLKDKSKFWLNSLLVGSIIT